MGIIRMVCKRFVSLRFADPAKVRMTLSTLHQYPMGLNLQIAQAWKPMKPAAHVWLTVDKSRHRTETEEPTIEYLAC